MDQLPDYFKALLPEDAIWRHDHVFQRYTTRCIDGIIKPFRRLRLCPEEVSFLKLIILLTKMPSEDTSGIQQDAVELKSRIIKAMFQFYRSSGVKNAE
ncbi:CBN-NHR-19 protein, partial [Aphelenchoides avenae]